MEKIQSNNPNTKLNGWTISREDFANHGEFIGWCATNRINGDWSLIWMAFSFQSEVNVFSNKG